MFQGWLYYLNLLYIAESCRSLNKQLLNPTIALGLKLNSSSKAELFDRAINNSNGIKIEFENN